METDKTATRNEADREVTNPVAENSAAKTADQEKWDRLHELYGQLGTGVLILEGNVNYHSPIVETLEKILSALIEIKRNVNMWIEKGDGDKEKLMEWSREIDEKAIEVWKEVEKHCI
jgi:hypothetical protein